MKKQSKILVQIIVFLTMVLSSYQVFAADIFSNLGELQFSGDYLKYLELSDDEKENVIAPRMYDIPKSKMTVTNPLKLARLLGSTVDSKYSLRTVIPENMVIKNQQLTNSCWTFSSLATLESTLALSDKINQRPAVVYDFSERHMEYATSKTFLDGTNKNGFNREVGEGGNVYLFVPYLTNGTGAIAEKEMEFEDNEDSIYISEIQNKNVVTQVNDIVTFPSYSSYDDKTMIKQQMKDHIKNYGGIDAGIYGASPSPNSDVYNNETGAIYCNNSIMYPINHAVTIIGWDDNYNVENFLEGNRPTSNGAWIIKNSWGTGGKQYTLTEMKEYILANFPDDCDNSGWTDATQIPDDITIENFKNWGYTIDENNVATQKVGDNGFMYISYEDVNIYKQLTGIENAQSEVTYENIYQYDQYGGALSAPFTVSKLYLANEFDKKTTKDEYLTQVSIMASEKYTCKVYVNPNGTSKEMRDLQLVQLKSGEAETFEAGYHTIEFLKPIKITGDKFVVVLEIQGFQTNSISIMMEFNYGEFFGDDGSIGYIYNNVTVENGKCFIANEDQIKNGQWNDTSTLNSLTNGNYPNFDTTLKAFTTTQTIDVIENSIESISIKTQPTKKEYFAGENFDSTGMVVEAIYTDGTIEQVTDYTITDGKSLKNGQTTVTIEYEGKTVTQAITVKANTSTEIIEEAGPENSNFDNVEGSIIGMKAHFSTESDEENYVILDIQLNNIIKTTENDKMEYFYYLSSSQKETNIKDWVKINKLKETDNGLSFEINTSNISNFAELNASDVLYLYIKEVATRNNKISEVVTSSILLEVENITIEEFVDGDKKGDVNSDTIVNPTPGEKLDNTLVAGTIPNAGKNILIVFVILAILVVGRLVYLRYKDIQIK